MTDQHDAAETPRATRLADYQAELTRRADPLSRRRFLELLGASLALAGAAACAPPRDLIVPFTRAPREVTSEKALYFASAHVLGGYAQGILVETHLGRPTKIEGNPQHPDSRGGTDAAGQASVLTLYDPHRSQTITSNGQISTWPDLLRTLHASLDTLRATGGQGLRVLTESVTSPTLADQMQQLLQALPGARWHRWQAVNADAARAGARLAFGQTVDPRFHFDQADVILSLDADPFAWAPGRLAYIRDFATRRRPERGAVNRVYAVESSPSMLGAAADHRLPLPSAAVEGLAFSVAQQLGLSFGAAAGQLPSGVTAGWLQALVDDLRRAGSRALVLAGDGQPAVVHALACALNAALGAVGTTVEYAAPVEADPVDHTASLRQLTDDMVSGQVSHLLILGGNPVYTAPADIPFADALQRVGLRIHLGLFDDETAERCQWHVAEAHPLETWSDARAFDGTATIVQPTIAPLSDSHSRHELLQVLIDGSSPTSHEIVQGYWQRQHGGADFTTFWRTSLHDGLVSGTATSPVAVSVVSSWAAGVTPAAAPSSDQLELVFRPDAALYDGQLAHNGWLLELPRPLTKLTWDNVALFSPTAAARYGVANEDVVELRLPQGVLRAPVWVQPGQADGSIAVALGYGRQRGAGAGDHVGFSVYGVRRADAPGFAGGLQVVRTGKTVPLASTQGHYTMEGRELVLTVPADAPRVDTQQPPTESLYPSYEYPGHAWGMVIDTSACVGCNACMVACQAENNVPIVGKDEVRRGREMHWLRVDTYFEGEPDTPRILQQLVPCMQCENAPCELVCPVGATVHSSEGLNDMVYNRCVGTRYCSNNCPYKVRHFNFFEYADFQTPSFKLLNNPDVTVRSRGVMEKCTYCVQRISAARIQAQKEDRPVADGEVVTACQAACPANAIVFGNLNDTQSAVRQQRGLARNYSLLAELNTRPRTTYLATVLNPNPTLASQTGQTDATA